MSMWRIVKTAGEQLSDALQYDWSLIPVSKKVVFQETALRSGYTDIDRPATDAELLQHAMKKVRETSLPLSTCESILEEWNRLRESRDEEVKEQKLNKMGE